MTIRSTRILFVVFFMFCAAAALNALYFQSGPSTTPAGRVAAERAQKEAEAERKRRLELSASDAALRTQIAPSAAPLPATASTAVVGTAAMPVSTKSAVEKNKPSAVPRAVQVQSQNRLPPPLPTAANAPSDETAKRFAKFKPDSWSSPPSAGAVPIGADTLPDAPDAEGDATTISAVQRELNARGYGPLATDGVPGLATRAAILAFEFDHNLSFAAEATDAILKRLLLGSSSNNEPAEPAGRVKTARAEALIRTVQQSLVSLGYDIGRVDGRFGEETQRAIKSFEIDEGLASKGRISAEVFARLARAVAVAKVQVVR